MIFLDATLHFTVLLVIHFLGQKSHCASATANSVVIINERTNLDPLRSLDRMEQILSTDRTRLSVSKSSDAMVKSFELKTGKKKKIIRPSPLPTRMPAIDKVVTTKPTVQVPEKGPPTKEDVISKPSTAAGAPSKALPATDKVVTTKPTVQAPKKGPPTEEDVTSKPSTAAGAPSKTVIGVPTTAIPNEDDSTTVINAPKEGNVPDDDNSKTSVSTDKPSGTNETGTGSDDVDVDESESGEDEPASKDKDADNSKNGGGSDDGKNGAEGNEAPIGAVAGGGTVDGDVDESESGEDEPASKDKDADNSKTGGGSDDGKNGAEGNEAPIGAGAVAGTDGNGQPEAAKAATPTYQPSSFQSPEKHLEIDTLLPVSLAPTAPTKGNKKGKFHKPTAQPIASKVNPSPKRSPPPTPPGATSVRSGSDPVDVTLVASEKSALTTVKYFFYTFMACVAVFGFIFCIRRYGPWTITGFITLPCYFQNVIYRVITLTLVSSLLFFHFLSIPLIAQSVQDQSHS